MAGERGASFKHEGGGCVIEGLNFNQNLKLILFHLLYNKLCCGMKYAYIFPAKSRFTGFAVDIGDGVQSCQ